MTTVLGRRDYSLELECYPNLFLCSTYILGFPHTLAPLLRKALTCLVSAHSGIL